MATANDLELYDRHAEDWWNLDAPAFRSLHRVDAFRIERLLAHLRGRGVDLEGLRAVDLGCGGGIVASHLGRAGVQVIGVDLSAASLNAAARGCEPAPILLLRGDAQHPPLVEGCADLVVLSDVLEHVRDPGAVLASAARLLKRGGHLYASTINRTLRGRVLAVTVAEGLGLVPRGTHDGRMFVRPGELVAAAQAAGLELVALDGEGVRLGATIARRRIEPRRARSLAVAYQALLTKPAEEGTR